MVRIWFENLHEQGRKVQVWTVGNYSKWYNVKQRCYFSEETNPDFRTFLSPYFRSSVYFDPVYGVFAQMYALFLEICTISGFLSDSDWHLCVQESLHCKNKMVWKFAWTRKDRTIMGTFRNNIGAINIVILIAPMLFLEVPMIEKVGIVKIKRFENLHCKNINTLKICIDKKGWYKHGF